MKGTRRAGTCHQPCILKKAAGSADGIKGIRVAKSFGIHLILIASSLATVCRFSPMPLVFSLKASVGVGNPPLPAPLDLP